MLAAMMQRMVLAGLVLWAGVGILNCGGNSQVSGFEPGTTSGVGGSQSTASGSTAVGGNGGAPASSSGGMGGGSELLLGPPYPIVLAHGFFGFEDFAGLSFINYFFGVRDHLKKQGEALVFTPAVDPFNTSTERGKQLLAQVEAILAQTGHSKVNLIGHSQGGLDARVLANLRPDLVASVITLQTPHKGTPIADVALKLIDNGNLSQILDFFLKTAGQALYDSIGESTSLQKPLQLFSSEGSAAFNAQYPDQANIYYGSFAGRSDWHLGGKDCKSEHEPDFVSKFRFETDPIDPLFAVTEAVLDGGLGDPYPNDGLMRVKDARWGQFLGCVPADHLDMIGHLLGDKPGLFNSWDHKDFYTSLVAMLRERGL